MKARMGRIFPRAASLIEEDEAAHAMGVAKGHRLHLQGRGALRQGFGRGQAARKEKWERAWRGIKGMLPKCTAYEERGSRPE